jgi:hypothetical protein
VNVVQDRIAGGMVELGCVERNGFGFGLLMSGGQRECLEREIFEQRWRTSMPRPEEVKRQARVRAAGKL